MDTRILFFLLGKKRKRRMVCVFVALCDWKLKDGELNLNEHDTGYFNPWRHYY